MNTDLISRADAEALFRNARGELHKSAIRNEQNGHPIKDLHTRDLMLLNAEQMIHLLPSVTPKQRWIPVSERLPSNGEWLLVSVDIHKNVYALDISVYRHNHFCHYNGEEIMRKVVAWMPLPEPYKAESEEQA